LRWSTFLRLHAQGIIACDFLIVVTATFRLLYVFVVIEHRSRRLIHCNITAHPSATWTAATAARGDWISRSIRIPAT
jgi:putative transposase